MEGALFDRHFHSFFLGDSLFSETGLALGSFGHDLALSFTSIAVLLHLLVHAGSHLEHLSNFVIYLDHTPFAFAFGASTYALSSLAFTGLAASGAFVGEFDNGAIIYLL